MSGADDSGRGNEKQRKKRSRRKKRVARLSEPVKAVALWDFAPKTSAQTHLSAFETVLVVTEDIGGWVKVQHLNNADERGYVPAAFIRLGDVQHHGPEEQQPSSSNPDAVRIPILKTGAAGVDTNADSSSRGVVRSSTVPSLASVETDETEESLDVARGRMLAALVSPGRAMTRASEEHVARDDEQDAAAAAAGSPYTDQVPAAKAQAQPKPQGTDGKDGEPVVIGEGHVLANRDAGSGGKIALCAAAPVQVYAVKEGGQWLYGRSGDQVGFMPTAYVKVVAWYDVTAAQRIGLSTSSAETLVARSLLKRGKAQGGNGPGASGTLDGEEEEDGESTEEDSSVEVSTSDESEHGHDIDEASAECAATKTAQDEDHGPGEGQASMPQPGQKATRPPPPQGGETTTPRDAETLVVVYVNGSTFDDLGLHTVTLTINATQTTSDVRAGVCAALKVEPPCGTLRVHHGSGENILLPEHRPLVELRRHRAVGSAELHWAEPSGGVTGLAKTSSELLKLGRVVSLSICGAAWEQLGISHFKFFVKPSDTANTLLAAVCEKLRLAQPVGTLVLEVVDAGKEVRLKPDDAILGQLRPLEKLGMVSVAWHAPIVSEEADVILQHLRDPSKAKLAVYKLYKTQLADPQVAQAFIQRNGIPELIRLLQDARASTQSYALQALLSTLMLPLPEVEETFALSLEAGTTIVRLATKLDSQHTAVVRNAQQVLSCLLRLPYACNAALQAWDVVYASRGEEGALGLLDCIGSEDTNTSVSALALLVDLCMAHEDPLAHLSSMDPAGRLDAVIGAQYEVELQPFREQLCRYAELCNLGWSDALATTFVPGKEDHEQLLRKLWETAYPAVPFKRTDAAWSNLLGFQGKDPSTDLRGGGLLGLHTMLFWATHRRGSLETICRRQRANEGTANFYPVATAAINVSVALAEAIGLGAQLVEPPPYLLTQRGFGDVFVACAEALDALFIHMNATYMEFPNVMTSFKAALARAMSATTLVRTVDDLRAWLHPDFDADAWADDKEVRRQAEASGGFSPAQWALLDASPHQARLKAFVDDPKPARFVNVDAVLHVIHMLDANEDAMRAPGLYRVSGETVSQRYVRGALSLGVPSVFEYGCVPHVWCGGLKLYLRELEPPLVPFAYYDKLIDVQRQHAPPDQETASMTAGAGSNGTPRLRGSSGNAGVFVTGDARAPSPPPLGEGTRAWLNAVTPWIRRLSTPAWTCLKALMEHLYRVQALAHVNKMTAHNLGIVFGPTLMRPATERLESMLTETRLRCDLVELLVLHHAAVFAQQPLEQETVAVEPGKAVGLFDLLCEEDATAMGMLAEPQGPGSPAGPGMAPSKASAGQQRRGTLPARFHDAGDASSGNPVGLLDLLSVQERQDLGAVSPKRSKHGRRQAKAARKAARRASKTRKDGSKGRLFGTWRRTSVDVEGQSRGGAGVDGNGDTGGAPNPPPPPAASQPQADANPTPSTLGEAGANLTLPDLPPSRVSSTQSDDEDRDDVSDEEYTVSSGSEDDTDEPSEDGASPSQLALPASAANDAVYSSSSALEALVASRMQASNPQRAPKGAVSDAASSSSSSSSSSSAHGANGRKGEGEEASKGKRRPYDRSLLKRDNTNVDLHRLGTAPTPPTHMFSKEGSGEGASMQPKTLRRRKPTVHLRRRSTGRRQRPVTLAPTTPIVEDESSQ